MKLNCLIIDDEPLARKGLKEYISDVDFLNLAGEYESPLKAVEKLNEIAAIHLLFLDIQMPKINGIEFFKTLQHAPPVIFTTAYPQYALEGFDVNALDYLVKPISFDRFLKAVMKAKEFYEVRQQNLSNETSGEYFFVKADNRLVKIAFTDILYAEALQNYVTIHTVDKKFMTYLTFKSMEEYLPADKFIKTHKSYIVAAAKIDSIEGNDIRIGSSHIPISRNEKDTEMEKLLKGKLLKR
ncbi:MAG: response regulator transcription factor [Chitinophagaceae bacterium]|nr:response regulator transcription factor [Chitinophagaceae bacterium]